MTNVACRLEFSRHDTRLLRPGRAYLAGWGNEHQLRLASTAVWIRLGDGDPHRHVMFYFDDGTSQWMLSPNGTSSYRVNLGGRMLQPGERVPLATGDRLRLTAPVWDDQARIQHLSIKLEAC